MPLTAQYVEGVLDPALLVEVALGVPDVEMGPELVELALLLGELQAVTRLAERDRLLDPRRVRAATDDELIKPRPAFHYRLPDSRIEDPDWVVEVFEEHNEDVKRTVPADRLVVYEIGQGWDPLADMLGVEAPDEPFPHLNDTESFRQMFGMPAVAA
jgi:hypothetical protein